jgi:hypothetical protein
MFHTVDLRLLQIANRVEGAETVDPTIPHRRELAALLRQERRARWAAWAGWLRSKVTGPRTSMLGRANQVSATCCA